MTWMPLLLRLACCTVDFLVRVVVSWSSCTVRHADPACKHKGGCEQTGMSCQRLHTRSKVNQQGSQYSCEASARVLLE
jgi:hypothetical protein